MREVPRLIIRDLRKEQHGFWGVMREEVRGESSKSENIQLSQVVSRCFESLFIVNYVIVKFSPSDANVYF